MEEALEKLTMKNHARAAAFSNIKSADKVWGEFGGVLVEE